ncbi:T-complex protein 1 subunit beta-like [Octopus sinensis]|uniref:T-complex protein 1 subunit beta-like n=1 Tax=Octopus sinensis TaxID=2607531 RepID=A0A6P7TQE9_9MOLL|nr:T-complex protein 1 subunit beta-like [Octopus sinensis]
MRLLKRRKPTKLKIIDGMGKTIYKPAEQTEIIADHFERQFNLNTDDIDPFTCTSAPLNKPIAVEEVIQAAKKLKNCRAAGPDNINAELIKYGPILLMEKLTTSFNEMFATNDLLPLGSGTLIPIQKANKTSGPVENLRPVILLNTLRKLFSLITLGRITRTVNEYLSPSHSGFRAGRSTADIVWSHRWRCAVQQKFKKSTVILGIDMSKAFDCVRRDLLIGVLESFLEVDEAEASLLPLQLLKQGANEEKAETARLDQGSLESIQIIKKLGGTLRDSFLDDGVAKGEACSLVIRGATQQIIDEADRSVHDALCVLYRTVNDTKIPSVIADNGGYDSMDLIHQLRAAHRQGLSTYGLETSSQEQDKITYHVERENCES